jgi:hypothetical protein
MVMNQSNTTATGDFCLRLKSDPFVPHVGYTGLNVDADIDKYYYDTIGSQSTLLIFFDGCGNKVKTYRYNIANAVNDEPSFLDTIYGSAFTRYCTKCSFNKMVCNMPEGPLDIDTLDVSSSISFDTAQTIRKVIRVRSGGTLTIDSTQIVFMPDTYIDVEPGGTLNINYSWLHGCDTLKWDGVKVEGNRDSIQQLAIVGSVLEDSQYLINVLHSPEISITQSYFHNSKDAITMSQCWRFIIDKNDFGDMERAIVTTYTGASTSQITDNYFTDMDECIKMKDDDHSQLDILCNKFDNYTQYAIHSEDCTLKDQGSGTYGAGNEFFSSSTNVNHYFKHKGNTARYYAGPSDTITLFTDSVNTAVVYSSTNDGCLNSRKPQTVAQENKMIASEITIWNAPNPSTGSTTIHFSSELREGGTIVMYNMYGGIIKTQPVAAGARNKEINCEELSNGIYFYALELNGKKVATGKMVISK